MSARGITAIRLILTCLEEACDWVAQDTGSDRKDDATSRGGLRWRRTRNYVVEVLGEGQIPELLGIEADVSDNALQVPVDGTRLSFYAARAGIDYPDLSGGSKVKKIVVSEMQMTLDELGEAARPPRLVLLYEADRDGLAKAAVGRLSSMHSWAEEWRFTLYEREEIGLDAAESTRAMPSYEEQPEPKLAPIEPIRPAIEIVEDD